MYVCVYEVKGSIVCSGWAITAVAHAIQISVLSAYFNQYSRPI